MRRRRLVMVLGVVALFAVWGTARGVDSWRYRTNLEQAKALIASGSPAEARRMLADSAARWPKEGEMTFLLGACEQALGRPDAALAAWSRVPTDSSFAGNAAMFRVRLLMKRDQFALAEELLPVALQASGQHAVEARETLVHLLNLEGRFAEVRALVQEGWDTYPDRFGLLRQLATLDSINPNPIETIRPELEKAAVNSPDDDRIWLGRANLGIRTGEFDKAQKWLEDCLRRRPRDAAVWKSQLDLALATGDAGLAREVIGHLPPDSVPPEQVLTLRAWFAARSGDQERERQTLEKLVERVPGRVRVVERLAELELLAGRPSALPGCAHERPSWIGQGSITRYSLRSPVMRPSVNLRKWHAWRSSWAGGSRPAPSGPWYWSARPATGRPARPGCGWNEPPRPVLVRRSQGFSPS